MLRGLTIFANIAITTSSALPVLCRVPDVQDFNRIIFHTVSNDLWQPSMR
jgi:hypothetical protein